MLRKNQAAPFFMSGKQLQDDADAIDDEPIVEAQMADAGFNDYYKIN